MKHAILSMSASKRWLKCTRAPRMEQKFPESTSAYAEEGTRAHALAEYRIRQSLKLPITSPAVPESDGLEMTRGVGVYHDHVLELVSTMLAADRHAQYWVEVRQDTSYYVPEGFGTVDFRGVAAHTLYIRDLKFGKGIKVDAEDNEQLQLYALGALRELDWMYDIETVNLGIIQPRLDHIDVVELSAGMLRSWGENYVRPQAVKAFNGEGDFNPGDHCRFCRAKAQCKALSVHLLDLAEQEFQDPTLLTKEDIVNVLQKAPLISVWADAVSGYALNEAIKGTHYDGFKLVRGRAVRQYREKATIEGILALDGYTPEQIYNRSLIGITDLEKLVGKEYISANLSECIVKPPGAITLVHESDKRRTYDPAETAQTDFENVNI
jgi:Protein of unknown function (DUF2800)